MGGGYGPSLESLLSKRCYSIDEHCLRQLKSERAELVPSALALVVSNGALGHPHAAASHC